VEKTIGENGPILAIPKTIHTEAKNRIEPPTGRYAKPSVDNKLNDKTGGDC